MLGAKIVPALWLATEKGPLCVACMDAGQERKQDAKSFVRHSFRMTKLHSSYEFSDNKCKTRFQPTAIDRREKTSRRNRILYCSTSKAEIASRNID